VGLIPPPSFSLRLPLSPLRVHHTQLLNVFTMPPRSHVPQAPLRVHATLTRTPLCGA
jgi:hypothetical protein